MADDSTDPAAAPAALPAAVSETHSAVVVFLGDRAYKVKKPLDLGFVDFRDRRTREQVCHDEVRLNQRLAPDVYLGVADVLGPDGELADHLVVMRRLPPDRRLAKLVADGVDVDEQLRALAHQLAAFHARADRGAEADTAAGRDAQAERWATNTAEMLDLAGSCLPADDVRTVDDLARRYLAGRGRLFAARIAEGRACDGHGDLLADDVFCLDDGPRVIDCLEFDARLRMGDALADVAFLAMDLEHLGRADLAQRFLDAYRDEAGDAWPASLAHHHIAYRAQVRAKVGAIRATQGDEGAAGRAVALLDLARRHLDAAAVRLVVVGGLPGTGKSTVAAGLADALDATLLRSDEVRKELAGIAAEQSATAAFREGLYAPEHTDETYDELFRRAEDALTEGESVVLDASFSAAEQRSRARRLAVDLSADLVELRCEVSPDEAAGRMRRRAAAGTDASDATPEVAEAMAESAAPWPEAHAVDTDDEPREVIDRAVALARAAPAGGRSAGAS